MHWQLGTSWLAIKSYGYCICVLSSCHTVILSSFDTVILSSCHPVILSSCHHAILSSCHAVLLSSCHPVVLSSCHYVIISSCHLVILSSCVPICWILFSLCFCVLEVYVSMIPCTCAQVHLFKFSAFLCSSVLVFHYSIIPKFLSLVPVSQYSLVPLE